MSDNEKTILLAGAGGLLGKKLLSRFLKQGYIVKTAVFRAEELAGIEHEHLVPVVCDVRNPDTLSGIADGCEMVVSVVGIGRIVGKLTHMDVDYQGNANLLEETKHADVKKFAFISPEGTAPNTGVALLEAKYLFEELLKSSGIDYVIVRSGGFFGDLLEMGKSAGKKPMFVIGSGENYFTPVDLEDLADFMVEKSLTGSGMCSIGGPENLTWEQICYTYQDYAGLPRKIVRIPIWLCSFAVAIISLFSLKYSSLGKLIIYMSTNDLPTDPVGKVSFADYLTQKGNE